MAEAIVKVERVALGYGARRVLEDVSFEVARSEVFVIAGRSGSGKTTLLKALIGLNEPAAGRVVVDGAEVARTSGAERRGFFRRIGVTFQGGALFGELTILENVRLPLEELTAFPPEIQDTIARSRLRLVGLGDAASLLPSEASGGMRKRVAIARALALSPGVLFLDEPSAGLDPLTSAAIDELILDLRSLLGITFVIVSHELASIFAIADRVLVLDEVRRRVAAIDTPERLRDRCPDPFVHAFFNRLPRAGERGREAA